MKDRTQLTLTDTNYLGAADALVPFYPALGTQADLEAGQDYTRHALQMFI